MNVNLQFDFIVSKDTNTITVKREFAGNRDLVWDCYTKSELLDQWFAPKPFTVKTKHMDFSEGGYWHYAMVAPDGTEFGNRMDYRKIRPKEFYSGLDAFCDESGVINPEFPRANWDVTFHDLGEHAMVETVVTYDSLNDLEKVISMGVKEGLTMSLENLDELIGKMKK